MMKQILVLASDQQREEWQLQQTVAADAVLEFAGNTDDSFFEKDADVYFLLDYDEFQELPVKTNKPVFVNAVINTLENFPANVIRINAWPGFLNRAITEVVASEENKTVVEEVMQTLNRDYQLVPDVPGMIAARTVSMIINEAYYALGEQVSSVEEIDIAMELGTNYPFGPFEWAQKIGIEQVYYLLKVLGRSNSRYTIAPALEEAVCKISAFKNTKIN